MKTQTYEAAAHETRLNANHVFGDPGMSDFGEVPLAFAQIADHHVCLQQPPRRLPVFGLSPACHGAFSSRRVLCKRQSDGVDSLSKFSGILQEDDGEVVVVTLVHVVRVLDDVFDLMEPSSGVVQGVGTDQDREVCSLFA